MINFCLHEVRVVPIICCLATRNNVHTQVSWSAGKLMCISHLHKLKGLVVCMTLCRLGIAVLWNTWSIFDFSWGGCWNSYICIIRFLRMGSKFKPISYFIYILFKEPGGHFTQIFFFKVPAGDGDSPEVRQGFAPGQHRFVFGGIFSF